MVEFGDEFIIESYRIPWLIWIQLVVMTLLIILLYFGFTLFDSDPSAVSTATAIPPQLDKPTTSNNPRRPKKEDRKLKMGAGTSGVPIREDETEDGESSMKESAVLKMFRSPNHPCNFLGHCKHAFLKCLGLDSSPESSGDCSHDKQE